MKIAVVAIGRLKSGPERALVERYLERTTAAGRKLGLGVAVREIPESRAGNPATRKSEEARALLESVPARSTLVALDETGGALDSQAFAARIGKWRDDGVETLVFAIGGADGHGDDLLKRADLRLAFGAMTWPHQLVRLLIAEQLYRAVTILAGHPYHRD